MDIAPATRPATPVSSTSDLEAAAEATPRIRLAVEMIPFLRRARRPKPSNPLDEVALLINEIRVKKMGERKSRTAAGLFCE